MNHLTNEQLEDIMQGQNIDLTHLNQCKDCQERLTEKQAIAAKLRSAFMSVKANESLAGRIRNQIIITNTGIDETRVITDIADST